MRLMSDPPYCLQLARPYSVSTTTTHTMRASTSLRAARRELQGTILIWRESLTTPSPIRSHPGAPVPSDTNPFARDPPPPPDASSESPSGIPLSHLKSRVRTMGDSQFVKYEKHAVPPVPHGVPPNFPDDQLEGKGRRIPPWAFWLGGMFLLSVVEDVMVSKSREAKKREEAARGEAEAVSGVRGERRERRAVSEAEREERIAAEAANRDEALQRAQEGGQVGWSDRMRAMNAQRAQLEERARRARSGAAAGPGPGQNQWGDGPSADNSQPTTDFYGRG